MRLTKAIAQSIFLIILSVLSSCETSDISEVSNKMPIEIRTIGTIEEEDAKRELGILLAGVKLADKFFVPIIDVIDITYTTDSTKLKTSQIKIPLSSIDAYSIGLTDEILDQSTYEDNLEDATLEKDSAYVLGLKILSGARGSFIKRKYLPSDPIKANEFYIGHSAAIKTDTSNHIFGTSEDLLNYIKNSKRNYTKLILFFMGGKSPSAMKDDDKDGVSNDLDKCPGVKGSISCDGCECPSNDIDGDGILNNIDKCPDKKGPKDNNGCPWPDSDRDGTPDKFDKCPEPGKCNGCECPTPPVKIPKVTIKHNNSTGKFTLEGFDSETMECNVTFIQNNGAIKEWVPSSNIFPNDDKNGREFQQLNNLIKDPTEMTVVLKVKLKKDNQEIVKESFNNLSVVCTKDGHCGFKNVN
jgi:hypothetical protein